MAPIMRSVHAAQDFPGRIISHPCCWKSIAGISMVVLLGSFYFSGTSSKVSGVSLALHSSKKEDDEHDDDMHLIFQSPPDKNRCHEEGDDVASSSLPTTKCKCLDPLIPVPRDNSPASMKHHQLQQEEVKTVKDIDVLFLGDSLVERWRGTRTSGTVVVEEYRQVFHNYFNKTAGGKMNGLALGTSGDVTPHTLWHLKNGWLPKNLKPKLFFLSIGTNDLQFGCSKKMTLVGILNIADLLYHMRPEVPVLIHGILPRMDYVASGNSSSNKKMGELWNKIMWINREIKNYAKMHKHWYYMDSAVIFLERDKETGDVVLKRSLVPDGLHPSVEGYEKWGARIAENALKILEKPPLT